jgi:hypothetical protein
MPEWAQSFVACRRSPGARDSAVTSRRSRRCRNDGSDQEDQNDQDDHPVLVEKTDQEQDVDVTGVVEHRSGELHDTEQPADGRRLGAPMREIVGCYPA